MFGNVAFVVLALGSLASAKTYTVDWGENHFANAARTINIGDTMTWIVQDVLSSITSYDPAQADEPLYTPLDSSFITKGSTFSWTFTEPGTFYYYSVAGPNVRSMVTVNDAVVTTTTTTTAAATTTTAAATTTAAPATTTTAAPATTTTAAPTTTTTTKTTTAATTTAEPKFCDDGYLYAENKCYKVFEAAFTGTHAFFACESNNAHLVSVRTPEEYKGVQAAIENSGISVSPYIGTMLDVFSSKYIWLIDGSAVPADTFDEAEDYSKATCVVFKGINDLKAVDCMEGRPFVCSKEPANVKPTDAPTDAPTATPTDAPTAAPTDAPTDGPTDAPTDGPTDGPTDAPTDAPTEPPASDEGFILMHTGLEGFSSTPSRFSTFLKKEFREFELRITSVEICEDECIKSAGCKGIVYYHDTGFCRGLSNVGQPVKTSLKASSYIRYPDAIINIKPTFTGKKPGTVNGQRFASISDPAARAFEETIPGGVVSTARVSYCASMCSEDASCAGFGIFIETGVCIGVTSVSDSVTTTDNVDSYVV